MLSKNDVTQISALFRAAMPRKSGGGKCIPFVRWTGIQVTSDLRSFRQTGHQTMTRLFRITATFLLGMIALGSVTLAQSLNPIPWPAPSAVPPPPAQVPSFQTKPAGV